MSNSESNPGSNWAGNLPDNSESNPADSMSDRSASYLPGRRHPWRLEWSLALGGLTIYHESLHSDVLDLTTALALSARPHPPPCLRARPDDCNIRAPSWAWPVHRPARSKGQQQTLLVTLDNRHHGGGHPVSCFRTEGSQGHIKRGKVELGGTGRAYCPAGLPSRTYISGSSGART